MPQDISVYVSRLRKLRMENPELYTKTLEGYRSAYPAFYNQLIAGLNMPQAPVQQVQHAAQPVVKAAPDINVYVSRLRKLKMDSLSDYNRTLEGYKSSNPVFYNQLINAMKDEGKISSSTSFKMFVNDYKFYLIAISFGIGIIIYLLFLLFSR